MNAMPEIMESKQLVARADDPERFRGKMHILVDTPLNSGPSEYANLGDVAMLQMAVRRLERTWPGAEIGVLTESPANLARFCPGAKPVPRAGRALWLGGTAMIGGFGQRLPEHASAGLSRFSRTLRLRWPKAYRSVLDLRLRLRDRGNVKPELHAYLNSIARAGLLVLCGAGGFTDDTRDWNNVTLDTMEEAMARNIPVAMFGQGLGPLQDVKTLARARSLFPRLVLMTLRGGRDGRALAESLGVRAPQLLSTGDEAVELAYEARPLQTGQAVGINLRVASYSNVGGEVIERLRRVLHEFALRRHAPLLPVPIAFHDWARDPASIKQLLRGFDDESDGGISLETPAKVIRQAGRCRIVVTGAYHAAVFALAQGIPVVGLSASPYYTSKFSGLKEQFGTGCETVALDAVDAMDQLRTAMERAWQSADAVRPPLLEAALRQITLAQEAYSQVKKLVGFRAGPVERMP